MELEIWRDVVGYKGLYLISNFGELKSIDRVIKTKDGKSFFRKGRNITIRKNNFGFYETRLYKNALIKYMPACVKQPKHMTFLIIIVRIS